MMDIDFDLSSFGESRKEVSSINRLQRAWISERAAPDILPYESRLLENISTRLKEQITWIEDELLSERDTKRTFRTVIVQTEVERVKFLVRSYLRARLQKIDKYAQYILSSENMLSLLSLDERQYLQKHNALLTSLYAAAFTNSFPAHLQNFNDSRNEEMIEKPDMDKAVFCRVIRTPDNGDITFANDEEITLEEGNIFLIRYSAVRKFIVDGDVELI